MRPSSGPEIPAKDPAWIRHGALAILILQNTALVLLLRYSRVMPGTPYLPSTAVASMESVKFLTCLVVLLVQDGFSFPTLVSQARRPRRARARRPPRFSTARRARRCLSPPPIAQLRVSLGLTEVLKLSVPSFLYTVQNNLLYFALKHLDAAPYQVRGRLARSSRDASLATSR